LIRPASPVGDQLLSSWLAIYAARTEEDKAEAVARTLAAVDALEGALADAQRTGGSAATASAWWTSRSADSCRR
jgi:hypothetical protein